MEVILDTNFIISCVLKRIDFLDELETMGFRVRIPREVLQEMKDLKRESKIGREKRIAIDLAFDMLKDVKKIRVGGRYADEGLIQKGKEGTYIATLDREIKRKVSNKIVIDSARNGLRIERD